MKRKWPVLRYNRTFVSVDCGNPQETLVKIVDAPVDIRTGYLPNKIQGVTA
jgi:hypothetical protein